MNSGPDVRMEKPCSRGKWTKMRRCLTAMLVGIVLVGIAGCAATDDKALLVHYDFDQGADRIVRDKSGNGNHALVNDVEFVKVGKGYALSFDGSEGIVTAAPTPALQTLKDAVTVEAWINPTSMKQLEAGVVGFRTSVTSGGGLTVFSGDKKARMHAGGGGKGAIGDKVECAVWTHLLGTFDGKVVRIYNNGKLTGTFLGKRPTLPSPDGLFIGAHGDNRFHGLIDDIRVYRRVLASEEVAGHFNKSKTEKGLK